MDRRLLPPPTHLPRSLHIHKLLKDPMGLGNQLCSWPGLLELLTGQPEFQVLLAELCLQEGAECSHPICGCGGRGKGRQIGRGLSSWTAEAREKGSHNVRPALTVQAPLPHICLKTLPLKHTGTLGDKLYLGLKDCSNRREKCWGSHSNNDYRGPGHSSSIFGGHCLSFNAESSVPWVHWWTCVSN